MQIEPIGVFDSGIGGLNVLRKCTELLPYEKFIYLADKANMPYGNKSAEEIKTAATLCAERLFAMNCKAVVIACNTATVTAVDHIRALYPTRIVIGLEPAVKPCYRELGKNGYAVALVTDATYRSEKFNRLVASCDNKIIPLAKPELAKLIEESAATDMAAVKDYVYSFLTEYKNAEAIILGCSHYTYITGIINEFYNGKIKIYDGAEGEAARLKYCLTLADKLASDIGTKPQITFLSTYKYVGI